MKFFADTANTDLLKELIEYGIVDGCTTNPLIIVKEGNLDVIKVIKDVLKIVKGPVSLEVTSNESEEMCSQARIFNSWGPNVVVKLPMNKEGMKALAKLSKEGIKTNVTACMSVKQGIFAAKAGATYVSYFWGRIEDLGIDPRKVVDETAEIYQTQHYPTKIIIGSVRNQNHVTDAMKTRAHYLTIPPHILMDMIHHPRTESTIREFLDNWNEFLKKDQKTEKKIRYVVDTRYSD